MLASPKQCCKGVLAKKDPCIFNCDNAVLIEEDFVRTRAAGTAIGHQGLEIADDSPGLDSWTS
jgi:hypothetical protein